MNLNARKKINAVLNLDIWLLYFICSLELIKFIAHFS